jgi:hypothetical protein
MLVGTPVARLEALKLGLPTDYTALRVCVETGKPGITDAELLLETRVAYAAWLSKAGSYGQADYDRFEWVQQDKCRKDDSSFTSIVVLADLAKETAGDDFRGSFPEPKINCSRRNCSTGMTTFGVGASAAWKVRFDGSNPQRWTELATGKPGYAVLSPYPQWTGLLTGIAADEGTTAAVKERVRTAYNALLAQAKPSFAQLTAFHALLAEVKLLAGYDAGFHEAASAFFASGAASISKAYTPRLPAMHVLLHEVGHGFGMQHADNPPGDSVNIATSDTTEAGGRFITKQAAMAYGEPFTYLTADDAAGIAHAGQSAREEIARHR